MIEIEHHQRHRPAVFALMGAQLDRAFHKGAAVEQAGQAVDGGRLAIDVDVMVLDHQQHDECGADRIDDRFQREYRQPIGGEQFRQERPQCERDHEDSRVQTRHDDGDGARIERVAALAPKLECDEERVAGDHGRAEGHVRDAAGLQGGNLAKDQPDNGAGERWRAAIGAVHGTGARRSRSCRRPRKSTPPETRAETRTSASARSTSPSTRRR